MDSWKIIKETKPEVIEKTVKLCKEKGIIIPTFAQMKNPDLIPKQIKEKLKNIGLWEVNPLNLFRINWHNSNPEEKDGKVYNNGNYVIFPEEFTGVKAKIVGVVGKYFPTGAHKVGAAFGCIVPRLVTGTFDPETEKAVWPSTGNYCRGGVFDCALLGCKAIAILPKGMSKERFEWLKDMGTDEVIGTPGSESNVKEIYDKCWELKRTRDNVNVFNQFEEFGNPIWHYHCTGGIISEIFEKIKTKDARLSGFCSATGSAGTIAAGDFLRTKYPLIKVVAGESLQCPTLFSNGFGAHRIEGIGDKHVPFIHNVKNTDCVSAVDDEQCMQLVRLLNEEAGNKYLREKIKVPEEFMKKKHLMGISGICNLISAIQTAKYFEMDEKDYIFIPLTDSMDLYSSRVKELQEEDEKKGEKYDEVKAAVNFERYLKATNCEFFKEINYKERKKLHNLKYFTWVEQQGKSVEELNAIWKDDFWKKTFAQVDEWDKLITEFNKKVGIDLNKL